MSNTLAILEIVSIFFPFFGVSLSIILPVSKRIIYFFYCRYRIVTKCNLLLECLLLFLSLPKSLEKYLGNKRLGLSA